MSEIVSKIQDFLDEHLIKFVLVFWLYLFICGFLGTPGHLEGGMSALLWVFRLFGYVMEYGIGAAIVLALLTAFITDVSADNNEYTLFSTMIMIAVLLLVSFLIYRLGKAVADNILFIILGFVGLGVIGTSTVIVIGPLGTIVEGGVMFFTSVFPEFVSVIVPFILAVGGLAIIADTIMSFF